eukprot:8693471-Pyramimonas_sp.AAC.1
MYRAFVRGHFGPVTGHRSDRAAPRPATLHRDRKGSTFYSCDVPSPLTRLLPTSDTIFNTIQQGWTKALSGGRPTLTCWNIRVTWLYVEKP